MRHLYFYLTGLIALFFLLPYLFSGSGEGQTKQKINLELILHYNRFCNGRCDVIGELKMYTTGYYIVQYSYDNEFWKTVFKYKNEINGENGKRFEFYVNVPKTTNFKVYVRVIKDGNIVLKKTIVFD